MDELDRRILALLQSDNRQSSAVVGQRIGLSVSAVNERIRRLNDTGAIRGNHAVPDPERVALPLCAFVFVDLAPHPDEAAFRGAIAARPDVQEIHQVSGPHCYLLKVRAAGPRALQQLLAAGIKTLPDVLRIETVMVLDTVKETPELPLEAGAT